MIDTNTLFIMCNTASISTYYMFERNCFFWKVPTFPVYTRSGEVNASIDLLNCNVSLSSEELRRLREFHRFTFTNVLRLEKDPMEFCSEKSELGYLIVPLDKGILVSFSLR